MFVWITAFLNLSRMWYTENQRRCFFEKVDDLYKEYSIQLIKEMLPSERIPEIEQKIRDGISIEDWWDDELFPGYDFEQFEQEKVYPAMHDDLIKNSCYWEDVCHNAPPERIEDWYKCSFVKSLLHEFVNDENDPYQLNDQLTEKEIACFSYAICSILVQYLKKHLHVKDKDADKILKILYCGEFAQNEWLNIVNGENIKEMRHRLTERFLRRFLSIDYNMGIEPALFSEFLHDEVLSPIYITIYDVRHEILKAGRDYLAKNAEKRWTPEEMDNFYNHIIANVKIEIEEPDIEGYM